MKQKVYHLAEGFSKSFSKNSVNGYHSANSVFSALMRKVYLWMALALAITGATSYGVAGTPALFSLLTGNLSLVLGLCLAEIILVIVLGHKLQHLSLTSATLLFISYSVLNGITLSVIFAIYTTTSIGSVFLIASCTFAIMAIYGFITKKSLISLGKMLLMSLLGLLLATIVNVFLGNSAFDLIISYIGVATFVILTAYDSQKIKIRLQEQHVISNHTLKLALYGAMEMYLDFINLFLYLLRIFGKKK